MHYTIRQAKESDVNAIAAMHAQSWIDTYPSNDHGISREWIEDRVNLMQEGEKLEKRRMLIRQSIAGDDALYYVAENEDGEIIGFTSPYRTPDIQRLGAIYVAKDYQGKGVAQMLMEKVIAWADPTRPIQLDVAAYNERAKAFYRKYDFKEVEGSEQLAYDKIPVVTMIREGEKQ